MPTQSQPSPAQVIDAESDLDACFEHDIRTGSRIRITDYNTGQFSDFTDPESVRDYCARLLGEVGELEQAIFEQQQQAFDDYNINDYESRRFHGDVA